MKLVIAGDFLHQLAIILKQHKETQVIEQHVWRQNAAHHGFQFAKLAQRIKTHAINRAPLHKPFGIAG